MRWRATNLSSESSSTPSLAATINLTDSRNSTSTFLTHFLSKAHMALNIIISSRTPSVLDSRNFPPQDSAAELRDLRGLISQNCFRTSCSLYFSSYCSWLASFSSGFFLLWLAAKSSSSESQEMALPAPTRGCTESSSPPPPSLTPGSQLPPCRP